MILGLVSKNICTVYTWLTKSQFDIAHLCVFVFNIQPTAKVICRLDHGFMSHLTDSGELGIKLVTPGLQAKWLIHFTTTAPYIAHLVVCLFYKMYKCKIFNKTRFILLQGFSSECKGL